MTRMKTMATTVTERGQVSIPATVRKRLNLTPGQRVTWEPISDHECRMKVAPESPILGAKAIFFYSSNFLRVRRTSEWMDEIRQGEIE